MRIVHCCLSCFYIDDHAYQENMLVAEHVRLGHDVLVVASTESFSDSRQMTYLAPGDYLGSDGARVMRLPYRIRPLRLGAKVRAYPGVRRILDEFRPDAIVFHGLCAWELITVAGFVRDNPATLFYVDSHEDHNNSARTILSRHLLHGIFYRSIIRTCSPQLRRILCVSTETMDFVARIYGIDRARLEYFPLGGTLWTDDDYLATRRRVREELGWTASLKVLLQSGKIDAAKRLDRTLDALERTPDESLRLVVAGQLMPDVAHALDARLDADPRIRRLGWVSPERLRDLLCAADVYVQPGSQSATMQMALCCRRPVVLDDVPSHRALVTDNGILVRDTNELAASLARIGSMTADELALMSERSSEIAQRLLDYRQQAHRVLQPQ